MFARFREDVGAIVKRRPRLIELIFIPLTTRGVRAVLLYRISSWLYRNRMPSLAFALRRFNDWLSGCTIHEASQIGGGLVLPHPFGVFIGRDARLGEHVWIFQGVTLGPRVDGGAGQEPRIGSRVLIYPNAGVYGPVSVGNYVVIGPGAIVYRDVPECSTVLPAEPRVLKGISAMYRSEDRALYAASQQGTSEIKSAKETEKESPRHEPSLAPV